MTEVTRLQLDGRGRITPDGESHTFDTLLVRIPTGYELTWSSGWTFDPGDFVQIEGRTKDHPVRGVFQVSSVLMQDSEPVSVSLTRLDVGEETVQPAPEVAPSEWNQAIDRCLEIVSPRVDDNDHYNDDGGLTAREIYDAIKAQRR